MTYRVVAALKFFTAKEDQYLYVLSDIYRKLYLVAGTSEEVFNKVLERDYDLKDVFESDVCFPPFKITRVLHRLYRMLRAIRQA